MRASPSRRAAAEERRRPAPRTDATQARHGRAAHRQEDRGDAPVGAVGVEPAHRLRHRGDRRAPRLRGDHLRSEFRCAEGRRSAPPRWSRRSSTSSSRSARPRPDGLVARGRGKMQGIPFFDTVGRRPAVARSSSTTASPGIATATAIAKWLFAEMAKRKGDDAPSSRSWRSPRRPSASTSSSSRTGDRRRGGRRMSRSSSSMTSTSPTSSRTRSTRSRRRCSSIPTSPASGRSATSASR